MDIWLAVILTLLTLLAYGVGFLAGYWTHHNEVNR